MKHMGNICNINGKSVSPVDIISFGAPCQDLSVAGKRMGLKHSAMGDEETTRSGLFYEAIRIIKEMREATNNEYPKYAVYENVPGAFSSNKGHDFHAVLEAFCSVCDGAVSIPKPYDAKQTDKLFWNKAGEIVGDNYSIAWRTLDAQYWGVPQRRKRIYLVADFTGRRAGEILFKPESLRGNLPQGDEAGEGATTDAVGGVDGSVGVVGLTNRGMVCDTAYETLRAGSHGALPLVAQKQSVDGSVGVECIACSVKQQSLVTTEECSNTLGANDWKEPQVIALNDQGGSSINVESEEISPTLRANSHQHEPVIAFTQNQREEVRDLGDKAGALAAEAGVHQQTYVAQPVIAMATQQGGAEIAENLCPTITAAAGMSGNNQPVVALQANGIDRAYGIDHVITTGGNCTAQGDCVYKDIQATLKAGGVHAVCYDARNHNAQDISGTIQAKSNGGQSLNYINPVCYDARGNGDGETACYTMQRSDENQACDVASTQSARQYKSATDLIVEKKLRYIIRRLTPTECARLQGFPDWWSELAPYNPDDAEFWEDVRKTHAEINGKKYKPVKDVKKWYDKLHTDSAEYKMWGNGIALPNARYVLQGIAEHGAKTLGSLFDGSGGFPLAGVLNGIKPIWASEVEPYPIAVTKSRFKEV